MQVFYLQVKLVSKKISALSKKSGKFHLIYFVFEKIQSALLEIIQ